MKLPTPKLHGSETSKKGRYNWRARKQEGVQISNVIQLKITATYMVVINRPYSFGSDENDPQLHQCRGWRCVHEYPAISRMALLEEL